MNEYDGVCDEAGTPQIPNLAEPEPKETQNLEIRSQKSEERSEK
jgi:hypothetical protein